MTRWTYEETSPTTCLSFTRTAGMSGWLRSCCTPTVPYEAPRPRAESRVAAVPASAFSVSRLLIHLRMEMMILELCISYLICDNDLLVHMQKSSFLQEFVYCYVIFLWHCLVQLSPELKWTVVTFESAYSWIVICHSYSFSSAHLILYVKPLLYTRHVTGAWNTVARQM